MHILGIETSCDETAAAVVEDGIHILSSALASSQKLQVKYGGILPEQAAREQVRSIIPVIQDSLLEAQQTTHTLDSLQKEKNTTPSLRNPKAQEYLTKDIDAIAITVGPGLIGSLLVGVETAKTFAYVRNKPIVPINHHLGHIYASWLATNQRPSLPAICLIVSGGHTLLLYMKDHGNWKILGSTRDDAAGEAFDKTARLLGLPYPGGPQIEKVAMSSLQHGGEHRFTFPRPMIDSGDYDFSFSGLKTAVLRETQRLGSEFSTPDSHLIADLAAGLQEAIVDVLIKKTIRAASEYKVKSIIVGGGVAANKRLEEKFMMHASLFNIHIPPPSLCTDNAAVIASAAFFNYQPIPWKEITADPNLKFPVK